MKRPGVDQQQLRQMKTGRGFIAARVFRGRCQRFAGVRQMIDTIMPGCDLEVDGGIDAATAPLAANAGANVLVAGSAIFGPCEGVMAAMKRLRAAVAQVTS